MTDIPPSPIHERRRRFVKRLGFALSALMVLLVLSIFALIVRTESAHDESTCPFARHSERSQGEAHVVEESRSCVPEAEEHRWIVERPGQAPLEFARKRLDKQRFSDTHFNWQLEQDEHQSLVIKLYVDGQMFSEFREADARGAPR
ncbi:MAG: hypothetical protein QM778_01490 [Myxococcales bacterium]